MCFDGLFRRVIGLIKNIWGLLGVGNEYPGVVGAGLLLVVTVVVEVVVVVVDLVVVLA